MLVLGGDIRVFATTKSAGNCPDEEQSIPMQRRVLKQESSAHVVVSGIGKSLAVKASFEGVSADSEVP